MEYCIQSLNVYFTYLKLFFLKVPPLLLVSFDPQFLISSDDQIMPPPPFQMNQGKPLVRCKKFIT